MKCARKVLLTVLVIFIMALGQGYARTPDQALEHPIFLTEIDDARMIFATYALKTGDLFLSYSEYDTFAQGYGALAFRTNLEGGGSTLSFIASKELGGVDVAFGIHRVTGEEGGWLLDLGLGGRVDMAGLRLGLHRLPLDSWEAMQENINISVGGSVYVTDYLVLGADVYPGEEWTYAVGADFLVRPDIGGSVKAEFQSTGFESGEAALWFTRDQLLLRLGYGLYKEEEELAGGLTLGAGFKF